MTTTTTNLLDQDTKLALYGRMQLLRKMEEQLVADFKRGDVLPGNVHLYIGQEAVAVGVCAHLTDRDWITSTHRGHGHFLAKGGDPTALLSEIYARVGGPCKGFGGTMHVADFSKGIVGANGIVGAGTPIATGAALSASLEGGDRVAVAFFGDGASNRGTLMESLNIAALWKLPAIYVCEDNTFSEFSPRDTVTSGNITDRGTALGVPSVSVDGNDVEAVWQAAARAVARARAHEGPSFIVARTYRQRGHAEAEVYWLSESYRTDEEVAAWVAKDPIPRYAAQLRNEGVSADRLTAIDAEIDKRVASAATAARASAPPSPELLRPFLPAGSTFQFSTEGK